MHRVSTYLCGLLAQRAKIGWPPNLPREANCRPASLPGIGLQFESAIPVPPPVSGGGRSVLLSTLKVWFKPD